MSWKDNLIKIEAYVAGEQPNKTDFIKLNANENPYPPSPEAIKAINGFDCEALRKYPSANSTELVKTIAEYHGLRSENVFAGNGSDDVLSLCFRAFFNSGRPILFPDITYSFNTVWCEILKIPYCQVKVDDNFNINPDDYKRENGGVVIANPNAPTSIGRDLDFLRTILDNNKNSVVIVDEAYVDFGGITAIPLLSEYENLVITRTFSKSRSMAGMRLGYALGSKDAINAIYAAKDSVNSYPVDSVAQAAGIASIKDEKYFRETLARVMKTRDDVAEKLRGMGFDVPESSTNFIFAEHKKYDAKSIFEYLKTKDIYVRWFNKPRINNRLRITIGTDEEMRALVSALEEYIK